MDHIRHIFHCPLVLCDSPRLDRGILLQLDWQQKKQEMERSCICKLCSEEFGDNLRPRVMSCGHSYCTDCLVKLCINENLSDVPCPRCDMIPPESSAGDFSINYDLEECLSEARHSKPSVTQPPQSNAKVIRMQTIITEQKPTIHNLIKSAADMQTQLQVYDEFLLEREAKHEAVLQKIHGLASLHEPIMKEIKEERKRIMNAQKEGDGYYKKVNNNLPNLDTAEGNKAAGAALAEVFECLCKLERWTDQCQHKFPYPKITEAEQILRKSVDNLYLVDSNTDESAPVASGVSSNDFTITEKLDNIDELSLTLVKLRLQPQRWRNRIAAGQVYAIRSNDGRKRSAKLSEKDGKLYLPYLQDREAPVLAYTIKHSELVNSLNKNYTVAFMDLGAWDGSFGGRVHISLSPDTPMARNFRILCTGELGPTYAHSLFCGYAKIGCYITDLGDPYEYNGVTSSFSATSGLTWNDMFYRHQMEGVVYESPEARDCERVTFAITKGFFHRNYNGFFGRVKEGIEVLKATAESRCITEVEITNCGVELPV